MYKRPGAKLKRLKYFYKAAEKAVHKSNEDAPVDGFLMGVVVVVTHRALKDNYPGGELQLGEKYLEGF